MELQKAVLKTSRDGKSLIAYAENGKIILFNNTQHFIGAQPGDHVSYSILKVAPKFTIANIEGVIKVNEIKPEVNQPVKTIIPVAPPNVEPEFETKVYIRKLVKAGRNNYGFLIPLKENRKLKPFHLHKFKLTIEAQKL